MMKSRVAFGLAMAVALMLLATLLLTKPLLRLVYPIPYRDAIIKSAEQFDADPFLVVAVMYVESRFDPHAESPKGARGLMQVMPDTATWAAEQMGHGELALGELDQPERNIQIGVWYLTYLLGLFDGQISTALAAYNAGPGNVRRWLDSGVWSGSAETLDDIPFGETRSYVRRVLNTYGIYRWLHEPISERKLAAA